MLLTSPHRLTVEQREKARAKVKKESSRKYTEVGGEDSLQKYTEVGDKERQGTVSGELQRVLVEHRGSGGS